MKNAKKVLAIILSLITIAGSVVVLGVGATAETASYTEETEPNDTAATANVVSSNGATGKLGVSSGSQGDIDFFKFKTTGAGLLNFTFNQNSASASTSSYFWVQILAPDAATVLSAFYVHGNEPTVVAPKCSLAALEAEEYYYVRVAEGSFCDPGNIVYSFSFTIDSDARCESEPNNAVDKADSIELSLDPDAIKAYTGLLSSSEDADWFTFNTTKPGYFYIFVYQDGTANAKANYEVELVCYDDSDEGVYSTPRSLGSFIAASNAERTISPAVGVGAGNYYVKITNSGTYSYGAYQVAVLFKDDAVSEMEPNNTMERATALTMGSEITSDSVIYGSNFDEADVDWYSLVLTSERDFTISLGADKATDTDIYRWEVSIYGPENDYSSPIQTITPTSKAAASYKFDKNAVGKYYIKVVSSQTISTSGDYVLTVSTIPHEKDKTFIDLVKEVDYSKIWSAISFIMNFTKGDMLKNLGEQLGKILIFIIGIFG